MKIRQLMLLVVLLIIHQIKAKIKNDEVRIQDFEEYKRTLAKEGILYEDPEFPANAASLFGESHRYMWTNIEWKRPGEIVNSPELTVDGFSRLDPIQGELGDCYLITAMTSLAMNSTAPARVIPQGQNFYDNYAGIFRVNFTYEEKWREIIIDDRLPTRGNQLIYSRSSKKNEFWTALLEKAFAKLYGSYVGIVSGMSGWALGHFVEGISEYWTRKHIPLNFFDILMEARRRNLSLVCSFESNETIGLYGQHTYAITDVKSLDIRVNGTTSPLNLLRIRNPFGGGEWNGKWSDRSDAWETIAQIERKNLGFKREEEGEFWIAYEELVGVVVTVAMFFPYHGPIDFHVLDGTLRNWTMDSIEGSWVRGVTAGGRKRLSDSFHHNPQYRITLEPLDQGDDDCAIMIDFIPSNVRPVTDDTSILQNMIGYYIYPLNCTNGCPTPLPEDYFSNNQPCGFATFKIVGDRKSLTLPPGSYCIIPDTYFLNVERTFILRVYSERGSNLEEYDQPIRFVETNHVMNDTSTNNDDQTIMNILNNHTSEVVGIDSVKLRNILNDLIPKGIEEREFDEHECRDFIDLVNGNKSANLNYEQFKTLWKHIERSKNAFMAHDANKTGILPDFELKQTLQDAGYHVNRRVLNILALHYRDDDNRKFSLSNYLKCTIHLKTLIDEYKRQNPTDTSPQSMTRWIEETLLSFFKN